MNPDDPMEHPDRDEMVMTIEIGSENYEQMRESAVDDIEDEIQSGNLTKEDVFESFVDARLLTDQMDIHIHQLYRNLTTLAIALTLIGSVLGYESYTADSMILGIWAVFSLTLAIITFQSTPRGTLRATLWEYYENIYDSIVSVLPS